MKALVCTAVNKVEVMEYPMPDYQGKILIKVKYAGICGSDLGIYHGQHPRAKMPLITGHEFVGVIEAISDDVETDLKVGDHVTANPILYCGKCRACINGSYHVCESLGLVGIDCDGGMAEFVAVDEHSVYKIPEDLAWEKAVLIEPVAVIVHGIRMIEPRFFGSALVIGGGPMGLLAAMMLKNAGMSKVIMSEINPNRLKRAEQFGIITIDPSQTDVLEKVYELTNGDGVDTLVEASGSPYVSESITKLAQIRGKILMLSVFKEPSKIDLRDINFKEQTMIGTRVYSDMDFKDAIDYTYQYQDELQYVRSHVFSIDEGAQAYATADDGKTDAMKVVIKCGE